MEAGAFEHDIPSGQDLQKYNAIPIKAKPVDHSAV